MRQQQPHRGQREEVGAADFEMADAHAVHHVADVVGLAVGADENGHAAFGVHLSIAFGEAGGIVALHLRVTDVEQAEVLLAVCRVVVGGGKQVASYAEVGDGKVVLHVEKVAWRTVVGVQVVYVVFAALFQRFEGLQFGADEGEYGLLLVAEVDDGGVRRREEVHQGKLQ